MTWDDGIKQPKLQSKYESVYVNRLGSSPTIECLQNSA